MMDVISLWVGRFVVGTVLGLALIIVFCYALTFVLEKLERLGRNG